jgi:RNA polymerase sigma-70 factor, ECF subfamily
MNLADTYRQAGVTGLTLIPGRVRPIDEAPVARDEQRNPDAIIPPMKLQELSDEGLIEQHRNGANTADAGQYLNELFSRYHVRVARWCLRFTGDRESAADLAQEICAKAYQNLGSFAGNAKFSTWMYSITRNHCLNAMKATSRRGMETTDEEVLAALPDKDSNDPHRAAERQSDARLVQELMNEALDETEKLVFTLHYGEEFSLDVITRLLNLENASGAKAYIVSAKRKLNRLIERRGARDRQPRV